MGKTEEKSEFIEINSVATHIMHFGFNGANIGRQQNWAQNNNTIILFIPGNPGLLDCCRDFMRQLYEKLNVPVIGMGHAGHSILPADYPLPNPTIESRPELYTLEAQVIHKQTFIEDYLTPNTNIICVGWSIGCYIILELLKSKIGDRIQRGILLFPTIERMCQTVEGQRITKLVNWFYYPLLASTNLIKHLPTAWQKKIMHHFLTKTIPGPKSGEQPVQSAIDGMLTILDPQCIKCVISMVVDELQQVNELDVETIDQNVERLSIFYADSDPWCPVTYFEEISKKYPKADIRLPFRHIPHGFILYDSFSNRVAEEVCDTVKKYAL